MHDHPPPDFDAWCAVHRELESGTPHAWVGPGYEPDERMSEPPRQRFRRPMTFTEMERRREIQRELQCVVVCRRCHAVRPMDMFEEDEGPRVCGPCMVELAYEHMQARMAGMRARKRDRYRQAHPWARPRVA